MACDDFRLAANHGIDRAIGCGHPNGTRGFGSSFIGAGFIDSDGQHGNGRTTAVCRPARTPSQDRVQGCQHLCWHPDDRADLAQEITAQLWRAFAGYDAQRSFSTWMYRIALNVAISQARSSSNRERHSVALDEELHEVTDPHGVDHEADEQLRALHRFMRQLDPLNRACWCSTSKTTATARLPTCSASARPTWRPRSAASSNASATTSPTERTHRT